MIRLRKNRLSFVAIHGTWLPFRATLHRDAQHSCAVRSPSGIFVCQEAKKAFDRRQSAVPSGDLDLAGLLSIIEEFDDRLRS